MKKINVSTQKLPNTYAIVDEDDYDYLNQWRWYAINDGRTIYARRSEFNKEKNITENYRMHRVIMNAQKGDIIDHINGNGLYNRKCNLRICTNVQNQYNKRARKDSTSGYKGVAYIEKKKKYYVEIQKGNLRIRKVSGKCIKEAVKYYNCLARILFGEFAYQNKLVE